MKINKYIWIIGLTFTLAIVIVPLAIFIPPTPQPVDNPQAFLPVRPPHTSHAALLQGPFESGSEVTLACLECHPDAASEVMQTTHWTWESEPVELPGRDEPVTIGKKTSLNNFCIGIQSNWTGCTRCHTGYGWEDENFDFSEQASVDCLVCHDQSGAYAKGNSGYPAEGSDLLAAAQSVGLPTRENCGYCHFNGGGGNGVKHGDLDESLYYPEDTQDVHMGELDFDCIDCHPAENHQVKGQAIGVSVELDNVVACTDCHSENLHADDRLNAHTQSVACQTCHIPAGATKDPTKMYWDWSTAGQDLPEDQHSYLKIKGSFIYENDFTPEYRWFSGIADRYILGDPVDPQGITEMVSLAGDISDPQAKIYPFKMHVAMQPYDSVYNYLVQPNTVGETGYWTTFDWDSAIRNGMEAVGLPFSGEYGFTQTSMYLQTTHMVQPKDQALQCADCHGENGRLDWTALGYPGDPVNWGGRSQSRP
jgi:octaheme c-type cytochrome (tetrathionate reductase family)